MPSTTHSTTSEKAIVCGTAFAAACSAFTVSVILLIPLTGVLFDAWGVPGIVQQAAILFELFGVPVLAAFVGLSIGMKFIAKPESATT